MPRTTRTNGVQMNTSSEEAGMRTSRTQATNDKITAACNVCTPLKDYQVNVSLTNMYKEFNREVRAYCINLKRYRENYEVRHIVELGAIHEDGVVFTRQDTKHMLSIFEKMYLKTMAPLLLNAEP